MIFQLYFALLFLYGINGDSTRPSNATVPSIQGNMCEVCTCKGNLILYGKGPHVKLHSGVDCSGKGLDGHFADEHWPKEPMVEVSFANNSIVHLKAFPEIAISKLILRENSITTIDDEAFLKLKNLTELDLSHNQLTTPLLGPHIFQGRFSPEAYTPLAKMEVLKLGYNALRSLHQDLFEHLGNLKVLSLEGNPLTVIDSPTVMAISSLPYLEKLYLSYCDLDDLPEHLFHTPKYLKLVDLTGNRFTSPPIALEDGKAIEWLALDENPIGIIDEKTAFPTMKSLKELSLCCMHNLTNIGAKSLSGLIALEILHVEGCPQLENIDEDALVTKDENGVAQWPPLTTLQLADNSLRYLPAGLVGRWDKLVDLDLQNNQWSCDCKNEYLVESLLPTLGKSLLKDDGGSLTCAAPPEHVGKNLTSLSKRHLRCLDLYNARPERDATILVGILIGVLLAIPVTLLIFVFWRRGFFFCGSQGPASFSRAFYKRADNDDDF